MVAGSPGSGYHIAGLLSRIPVPAILRSDAVTVSLAAFIGSRLPIFLLASVFVGFVPVAADRLPHFQDAFTQWDGGWYLSIAQGGYQWKGSFMEQSNLAFFPLYPFLGKFFGGFLGGNARLGLLLASNLSFLAYLYLLHKLVSLDLDKSTASRAVTYVSVFPMSIFFSVAYTEATLLALVTGAFYFARTDRWKLAVLLGGLACVTRAAGIIVIFPLVYEYIRQKGLKPSILSLAAMLTPLAAYVAYVWRETGIPSGLMFTTSAWERAYTPLWDTALSAWGGVFRPDKPYDQSIIVMDALIFFAFLLLTILVVWRLPRSYAVYAVPAFLFATSTTVAGYPLASMSRYLLAVFPCFILLSILGRNTLVHRCLVSTFTAFLGVVTIYFFGSFWIA